MRRVVAQLGAAVLIVARLDGDNRTVRHVVQHDHLEGARQRFVAPPVRWQCAAENRWRSGLDEFAVVFLHHAVHVGDHLVEGRLHWVDGLGPRIWWRRGGRVVAAGVGGGGVVVVV